MSLMASKFLSRACSQTQKILAAPACISVFQVAGITSAGGKPRARPYKTFDYRNQKVYTFTQFWDRTSKRMLDENNRMIVVDGPIASGKHRFAQMLAKELDFFYVPQPDPMELHACQEGLNYKDLDELLPEKYRIYDLDTFLADENAKPSQGGGRVGQLQWEYFAARLFAYNDALLHMLSIGECSP